MKTESKDTISRDLELIQTHLRKLERHEKKLSTCEADMAEMRAKIQSIGKPSYKNEAALYELSTLNLRLKLCEEEAAELSAELPFVRNELNAKIHPVSVRAARLLTPLVERRVSTITAVLMPFCNSESNAMAAARVTDAFQAAHGSIFQITQPSLSGAGLLRHARIVVSILEEALKKDGDLLQFLAPPIRKGNDAREPAGVKAS